jgi:hypothetical protein
VRCLFDSTVLNRWRISSIDPTIRAERLPSQQEKIGGVKTLNVDHLNQLRLDVRIAIGETRFNVVRIALRDYTRVWIRKMRIP